MSDTDTNTAPGRLQSFIQRVERLEEEKADTITCINAVYGEAKNEGFDPAIMRQVVRLRRMDEDKRATQQDLLDTYMVALGMAPSE